MEKTAWVRKLIVRLSQRPLAAWLASVHRAGLFDGSTRAAKAKPPAKAARAVLGIPAAACHVWAEATFATTVWHD